MSTINTLKDNATYLFLEEFGRYPTETELYNYIEQLYSIECED